MWPLLDGARAGCDGTCVLGALPLSQVACRSRRSDELIRRGMSR